jgi:RsiW-degrading membrane proteinase PrsW (M82 family)
MVMTTISERFPATRRTLHLRWLAVLLSGLALVWAVSVVMLDTGDPVFLPTLLLLGAAVVPATLATFVTEVERDHRLPLPRIIAGAVLGGVVGGVLAGQLEFETAHAIGSLPFTMVGLIEECAKLAIPVALLAWRRPRPRAVDGLVLGVAVGSAFAAVETMGYAFVVLLSTHGQLAPVVDVLALRAVGSLGGHAAWTGLACAALFGIFNARSRMLGWLRFVAVLAGVVTLHAAWDTAARAGGHGDLAIGLLSFGLLMGATWWLRRRPQQRRASGMQIDGKTPGMAA